ncbi:SDR family oxidoreductase [Yinghuangia soli]|uniref:SDR family oxidoreductase n=1 Tax=Yinghuangia soli TaxID=2908204 RepID=A0AA41Q8J6_9ACTN|nr:SDR family oxidoreductase [Yinghuangia soli]MCF2533423.1 SDR family oxidoreductase [Yinghuangia soli]
MTPTTGHTDIPAQEQPYPGVTEAMEPRPRDAMADYTGSGLLAGRRALITGGDSGIGRAVAVAFAKEGADVAIGYLSEAEDEDAAHTARLVEAEGRRCIVHRADLSSEEPCRTLVAAAAEGLSGLDLLVNNCAYQEPVEDFADLDSETWEHTFRVNVHSYFWTTKAALPHLRKGSAIINTSSINGLRGNATLIDYSASKGAVLALTYALSQALRERGIRVNCVAPGPVWTPLIPATFPAERVASFGEQAPMGRAAEPDEIAPSYVFFAAERLSSYYTGEVLTPIGGETLPG